MLFKRVINKYTPHYHHIPSITLPWVYKVGTTEWFHPEGLQAFKLCKGVQLYPHRRMGLTSIPCAQDKGCLTSSNLFLIRHECPTKGSTGARSMSQIFLTDATPLPVSWINRSQLVTWLIDPIRDMLCVWVVTRIQ
jgi:hypothetical protein